MRVTFYAHASFRLEGDGIAVVTDPYTPGAAASGFDPIDEAADVVIMSSATDRFHSDPSHVRGDPIVVNALDVPPEGIATAGLLIRAFPAFESLTFDYRTRDPDANALYHFTLGGVRVLHMGDLGNPLAAEHVEALRGEVDLLFALAGEHATIGLDDLLPAIEAIGPRFVVPMHYYSPRGRLAIEPVERFLARVPETSITRVGASEVEIGPETASAAPFRVLVLDESR